LPNFYLLNPANFVNQAIWQSNKYISHFKWFFQPTIGNLQSTRYLSPPHLYPLPAGSDHYPYLYIIRSRYILIFEENYGWFAVLSILLTPNFNALLNPIQGVLRKPRLLLTANFLPEFFSTFFYEKISGIPAS